MILAAGAAPSAPLPLPAGPAAWDLANPAGGPVLAMATSMAGVPGVRVVDGPEAMAPRPDGAAMAVGSRSAVSVALAGQQPAAVLWQAQASAEPMEVRLRSWSFAPPENDTATWGVRDGSIAGLRAQAFDLPAGAKRLRLALGTDTVAALGEGTGVQSVHWAGGVAFEETIETSAGRLTLLHVAPGEDRYGLEILPTDASEPASILQPQAPVERALSRAGSMRLALRATGTEPGLSAHVRGAADEAVFVGADGHVATGLDLGGSGPGTLWVHHGPGRVLAWLDRPGQEELALWGGLQAPAAAEVATPATVPLSGAIQALGSPPRVP